MLRPNDLRGRLFPAVPVPMTSDGQIHVEGQGRYAAWMAGQPIGGVAIWAHTGRGLYLTRGQRAEVLSSWRKTMGADRVVIAAAGAPAGDARPDRVTQAAGDLARQAADGGADALLVHPPTSLWGLPDLDRLVLDYHAAVAEAGLPLILFLLYEAAGGILYPPDVLRALLARPQVVGIKVATLDSVVTFQDVATLVRDHAPDKVLLTGEDRFLGYSLMCGANAALIGMGAACTTLQADLLHRHRSGDAARFLALNGRVDDLARHTFMAPMEGYILRMLWCLVHQGILSADAAHDPWGPALDSAEFDRLGECLSRIAD